MRQIFKLFSTERDNVAQSEDGTFWIRVRMVAATGQVRGGISDGHALSVEAVNIFLTRKLILNQLLINRHLQYRSGTVITVTDLVQ